MPAITVAMRTEISNLYVSLFGRAPDGEGLGFWVSSYSNGNTLAKIAQAMYDTAPARAYYPLFATPSEVVTTFYTNVLGRAPDAEGLAFWVKEYNASATQGAFFEKLINNVVNYNGTDAAGVASKSLFVNKVAVAQYYGEQNGTVAGATAALNGVTSAAASVDAAKAVILNTAVSGQSFALTTGVDNFSGGSGADAFSGVIANVAAANTTGTTFQAGDSISGGAGTDTLSISVTGGNAGTNAAVTLTGIEKVLVSNVNSATQSINLALADSSLTTVGHASSNTNAVTTFAGLNKIVASELSNGDAGITLTYNATVIAGTADSASLTLSNQTGGTFTSTGIETLNVASNTSANTVTLAAGPTTVNVSGAAKLTLGSLDTGITTLNASANTGGVVATLSSTATAVITGSSAADTFTAGTNMSGVGAVNAGDGVDTLVSTADALIATAADGARFTNFETLSISSTALIEGAQTRDQNMSLIGGINTINVTSGRVVTGGAGNATHAVGLTNLAATTNTLNVTGLFNADSTVGTDGLDVTVTATRAVNTAADSMTVNLGTSTAVVGTTAVATGGAAAGAVTLALSLANEESITLNSLGGTTGTNFVAGITNGSATSVTATGARALSFASMSSTVVTKIDASAMTGAFIMGTNAGTVASTISGGTGADTLTGGSAADNISGGAGNDSITGDAGADVITGGDGLDTILGGAGIDNLSGGAGNDTFLVTTVAHFTNLTSAEVVSGGDGVLDTLSFAENTTLTVSAADLTGINSIERITFDGDANTATITLSDAVYTANGATTLAVADADLVQGALSVNASALTAANSVQITANTVAVGGAIADTLIGGAGADTFFFSVNGLNATDTVTGGAGTDTISLSAAAAVTAVMDGVTLVESIVITGSAADVSIDLNADAVIAAGGTLTVNASSMTAGAAIELTYAGNDITTTTKIQNVTGSAGDDIIAGGSGNDIIVGADGNDSITGGIGIDNLSGGSGNDIFVIATTGTGFTGLTTAETVSGGAGNDMLQVAAGAITIAAADLVNVSGVETIVISNTTETASLTITDAWFTANGTTSLTVNSVTATTGALTLAASTVSAANSLVVDAGGTTTAAHVINLGAGNDSLTIDMSALNNTTTLAGGAGTDTLIFSANTGSGSITQDATVTGFETVSFLTAGVAGTFATVVNNAGVAAAATQTVNASNVTGTLLWNGAAELDGKFSITGGTGADSLTGGSLADTIIGGLGNDVITGGLGADSLTGSLGIDTFVYALVTQSNSSNTDTITDFVTGTDKLRFTLDYNAQVVALDINAVRASAGVAGTSAAQDTLSGQRGQYVYDTTNSALFVNVNNDNLLTTSDYKVNINAASTASASIVDGDIEFVITAGSNADSITTGSGADTIDGASGADTIVAGAGNDSISGGEGNDVITSGTGVDSIAGGGGADIIAFSVGDSNPIASGANGTSTGTDSITDWVSGDLIQITVTSADTTWDMDHVLVGTAGGAQTTGTVTSYTTSTLLVQAGDTTVAADGYDIVVNVQNGATRVFADAAAAAAATVVNLTGTSGADTLTTGANNDTITAGNGIDAITGGAGNDTIILTDTDSAADTVNLASSAATNGVDTITGFALATDILNWAQGTSEVNAASTFTTAANAIYQLGAQAAGAADSAAAVAVAMNAAATITAAGNTAWIAISDNNSTSIWAWVDVNGVADEVNVAEITLVATIDAAMTTAQLATAITV